MEANQTPEVSGGVPTASPSTVKPRPPQDIKLFGITVVAGIAFDLCVGSVLRELRLPLPLDLIGTIMVTLLLGSVPGMLTGLLVPFIKMWAFNPELVYDLNPEFLAGSLGGTVVALCVGVLASRGFFRSIRRSMGSGVLIGVVITILHFAMLTGVRGLDGFVTTMLLGSIIFVSGGIAIQCLLAFLLLRQLPTNLRAKFGYTR